MTKSRNLLIKEIKKRINQELNDRSVLEKKYGWDRTARPGQRIPEGNWHTWLILAGRGFGKTRTGNPMTDKAFSKKHTCATTILSIAFIDVLE